VRQLFDFQRMDEDTATFDDPSNNAGLEPPSYGVRI